MCSPILSQGRNSKVSPRCRFNYAMMLLLLGVVSTTALGQTIVYVDANATGPVFDGSSWCNAYQDLQQALAVAGVDTEVRVAQGVYKPGTSGDREATFAIPSGSIINGSYQGCGTLDPDARDFVLFETILNGDQNGDDGLNFNNRLENVYHVVTTHNVSAATVIDGFTISGGYANGTNFGASPASRDQGSGVNNYLGFPTVSNCKITDNYSVNHGAFNDHGKATLIGCELRGNKSGNVAAGLYMHFSVDTTVTNCSFYDNVTAGRGGGAYLKGDSSPTFTGCLFSGNSGLLGGGMYSDSNNSPTLTNCTFDSNIAGPGAGRGAGLYTLSSIISMTGCSFQRNSGNDNDDDDSGGGAIYGEGSTLAIDQSDFVANRAHATGFTGGGGVYLISSSATMTQCLFDNNSSSRYGGALRIAESSTISVSDCVFTGNSSYYNAIIITISSAEFSRCLLTAC